MSNTEIYNVILAQPNAIASWRNTVCYRIDQNGRCCDRISRPREVVSTPDIGISERAAATLKNDASP